MSGEQLHAQYYQQLERLRALSNKMAAAGIIVKDRPHLRIYHDVIRELQAAAPAGRQELAVLLEMGCHADPTGWCWPGIDRLARQTSYARSTVIAALTRLLNRDYVRYVVTERPGAARPHLDYMVSPAAHCVRPELRAAAWEQYNALKHRNTLPDFVMNESQPIYNQAPRTNNSNQHQNQPPPPPIQQSTKAGAEESLHEVTEGQKAKHNRQPPTADKASANGATSEAPTEGSDSERSTTPPISAAPPPVPDGFDGNAALADAEAEAAAHQLRIDFGASLSLSNARLLVEQYGTQRVLGVAGTIRYMSDVRNPVGLLRHRLRTKIASEDDHWHNLADGVPRPGAAVEVEGVEDEEEEIPF